MCEFLNKIRQISTYNLALFDSAVEFTKQQSRISSKRKPSVKIELVVLRGLCLAETSIDPRITGVVSKDSRKLLIKFYVTFAVWC